MSKLSAMRIAVEIDGTETPRSIFETKLFVRWDAEDNCSSVMSRCVRRKRMRAPIPCREGERSGNAAGRFFLPRGDNSFFAIRCFMDEGWTLAYAVGYSRMAQISLYMLMPPPSTEPEAQE